MCVCTTSGAAHANIGSCARQPTGSSTCTHHVHHDTQQSRQADGKACNAGLLQCCRRPAAPAPAASSAAARLPPGTLLAPPPSASGLWVLQIGMVAAVGRVTTENTICRAGHSNICLVSMESCASLHAAQRSCKGAVPSLRVSGHCHPAEQHMHCVALLSQRNGTDSGTAVACVMELL